MMSSFWALHGKEWRISLDTPLGYVVATAFLFASGFFFGKNLFLYGQADMRGYFGVLPLLLMFFTPAVTMRLIADERHDGTFELLATMPVSTLTIIAAKFAFAWGQVGLWLLMTSVYAGSLALLGDVDGGQIAAGYVAAFLLAAFYASVGLFASSLSSRSIVAYVIGFVLVLAFFLLGATAGTLPVGWQDVLALVSPLAHFDRMLRGVVGLDDLVIPLAWTLLFLGLSWFQLERRQWQ